MSFRKTISYILWPLTMWYAVGVRLRNIGFMFGLRKQEVPHITTIGVGNLRTGGTGKTPHVEYLLRLLADHYPTAMLSRGYKRKSKGYVEDDGSHSMHDLGDEAAMMARKFPNVKVAVCEKRMEGVRRLMEDGENAPKVIVLDDVFQHRQIKPSINILLTEYRHPYYNDHILPYGDLREFKSARFRANIVIVTKSPANLNPIERHNIVHDLRLQNYQKVFFSYLKYGKLRTLEGEEADIDLQHMDNVLVVTGIVHPEPLIAEIRKQSKTQHLGFPDHHNFDKRDIEEIRKAFDSMPNGRKIIVTTEKDATRLTGKCDGLPIYVMPVEVAFHNNSDLNFDTLIDSTVRENISFLSKLSIWS